MCSACSSDRQSATWSCDNVFVVFIPLWKLNLLHVCLNVTQRFVMHIIPHANMYFICMKILQLVMESNFRYCYAVESTERHREERLSKEFNAVCS
jgi:hypothetical protein